MYRLLDSICRIEVTILSSPYFPKFYQCNRYLLVLYVYPRHLRRDEPASLDRTYQEIYRGTDEKSKVKKLYMSML